MVALKFISKADASWSQQQMKEIDAEIAAMTQIRHRNVLKIYAYNKDAKYPLSNPKNSKNGKQKNGSSHAPLEYAPTILLVMEYAACGELFNLLYYTQGLNDSLARTYFRQIVQSVEEIHNQGVIHRDIRPKNLLLNHNYNIKLANFHRCKVVRADSDFVMKTKYIGSRSYQSPEILQNAAVYDFRCDIFSVGVILFILLAGYPPFECATASDPWYKQIIDKKYEKFWRAHQKVAIDANAKNLIVRMLASDFTTRISIAEIKQHAWFNGHVLGAYALQQAMQERYRVSERRRLKHIKSNPGASASGADDNTNRPLEQGPPYALVLFPAQRDEILCGGVYTFGFDNPRPIYDRLSAAITTKGFCKFSQRDNRLLCTMRPSEHNEIKFAICVYQSRVWLDRCKQYAVELGVDVDVMVGKYEHMVYIVCIDRLHGDEWLFRKIKNEYLLQQCSDIFLGLPHWARKLTPSAFWNEYASKCLVAGYMRDMDWRVSVTGVVFLYVYDGQHRANEQDEEDEENENAAYQAALSNLTW